MMGWIVHNARIIMLANSEFVYREFVGFAKVFTERRNVIQ
jgi:hypothetical protein